MGGSFGVILYLFRSVSSLVLTIRKSIVMIVVIIIEAIITAMMIIITVIIIVIAMAAFEFLFSF